MTQGKHTVHGVCTDTLCSKHQCLPVQLGYHPCDKVPVVVNVHVPHLLRLVINVAKLVICIIYIFSIH